MATKKTKKIEKSIAVGDTKLTLSSGHLAEQTNGAVMAKLGETVVLAVVVEDELRRDIDYFPLQVEYQEKLYAGGRIKGSRWVKREGRPNDDEILTARFIDRSIRPLFPKGYKKDVQVIITVLSVDLENSPAIAAAIATSAAIESSNLPWKGPIGVTQIGIVEGELKVNPVDARIEQSDLDLIVSGTKEAVVMIEAGASEVDEDTLVEGVERAQKENKKLIKFIKKFAGEFGVKKKKVEVNEPDTKLIKEVDKLFGDKIESLMADMAVKKAGYGDYDDLKDVVKEDFDDEEKDLAGKAFEQLFKKKMRKTILSGKRVDGRKHDELRDLSAEISLLPRTHGSAIFNRGETQALTIATLGAPSLEQYIESAEGEEKKRYIHHYTMPPFSVGETGRYGSPKRREIGHGALAEKALLPVIPDRKEFPYTIRVVTEILSSNGSTSMASTCGSSLSLMDAGVPISAPVAGIAMGLIIEDEDNYAILTDIVGVEDGNGDMDFKVAGTKNGITAIQLDVKTLSLKVGMLKEALKQAKEARLEILDVMTKAIGEPKDAVSEYAPKIKVINIPKKKIGDLIGPGGKTIKGIIAKTGAQVDVDDEGKVTISAPTKEELENAVEMAEMLVKEVEPGEIYEGEVKRIEDYGAFVEVLPGKDGLVYISDMSEDYVKKPSDEVSLGDKVKVRVKEIDKLGRINLSMILDPKKERKRGKKGGGRKKGSGGRNNRKGRGSKKRSSGRSRSKKKKGGGPHFPASRLMDDSKK